MAKVIIRGRRRRKNTYSISKRARMIGHGFLYVGLASGILAGVAFLVNTIGSVTFQLGDQTVDMTMFLTIGSALISILLFAKAARYFGVRI